ncbi:dTMP kinase [Tessaracoccus palaemonis]|uniref:Thymidylate kinase n=1 Tax=Tessaracoccus palaemonis TaxID=2829499 RepID=A0ABX8SJ10_9ACTN|nr:dTMP kinase [Tessaracoccus palaemonis]QXT62447.1 dTMP kinase [Tessaracoccus palaemonis]
MTGLFVVFEGGDSVGKTTQVALLGTWLAERSVPHVVTRQPGGTEVGAELRRLVLDPSFGDVSPRAEALMYAADKAQHVYELVSPALEAGQVVVCDRYVDSMVAYQGAGRALGQDEVARIAWWAVGDLRPDLTILLDADPGDAVATIKDKDRLESAGLDVHRRARQFFLDLAAAEPARYLVLNARGTREEIAAAIRDRLLPMLP